MARAASICCLYCLDRGISIQGLSCWRYLHQSTSESKRTRNDKTEMFSAHRQRWVTFSLTVGINPSNTTHTETHNMRAHIHTQTHTLRGKKTESSNVEMLTTYN